MDWKFWPAWFPKCATTVLHLSNNVNQNFSFTARGWNADNPLRFLRFSRRLGLFIISGQRRARRDPQNGSKIWPQKSKFWKRRKSIFSCDENSSSKATNAEGKIILFRKIIKCDISDFCKQFSKNMRFSW